MITEALGQILVWVAEMGEIDDLSSYQSCFNLFFFPPKQLKSCENDIYKIRRQGHRCNSLSLVFLSFFFSDPGSLKTVRCPLGQRCRECKPIAVGTPAIEPCRNLYNHIRQ